MEVSSRVFRIQSNPFDELIGGRFFYFVFSICNWRETEAAVLASTSYDKTTVNQTTAIFKYSLSQGWLAVNLLISES